MGTVLNWVVGELVTMAFSMSKQEGKHSEHNNVKGQKGPLSPAADDVVNSVNEGDPTDEFNSQQDHNEAIDVGAFVLAELDHSEKEGSEATGKEIPRPMGHTDRYRNRYHDHKRNHHQGQPRCR